MLGTGDFYAPVRLTQRLAQYSAFNHNQRLREYVMDLEKDDGENNKRKEDSFMKEGSSNPPAPNSDFVNAFTGVHNTFLMGSEIRELDSVADELNKRLLEVITESVRESRKLAVLQEELKGKR